MQEKQTKCLYIKYDSSPQILRQQPRYYSRLPDRFFATNRLRHLPLSANSAFGKSVSQICVLMTQCTSIQQYDYTLIIYVCQYLIILLFTMLKNFPLFRSQHSQKSLHPCQGLWQLPYLHPQFRRCDELHPICRLQYTPWDLLFCP